MNAELEPQADAGTQASRREFLKSTLSASGVLVLGFQLLIAALNRAHAAGNAALAEGATTLMDGWLIIHPDNRIVLRVASAEMGQGVTTSMPMLIAEELEVDWRLIETEIAPVAKALTNLAFNMQATDGSTSIRWSFNFLRQVGARAREMLRLAAANRWSVTVVEVGAAKGAMQHIPSNQRATYGELAADALTQQAAKEVPFTPRSQ